jgi:Fic family protein
MVVKPALLEPVLPPDEIAAARQRRLEAMTLHEIEGNPLSEEDVALFEMFEREGWTHERVRAHLLTLAHADALKPRR